MCSPHRHLDPASPEAESPDYLVSKPKVPSDLKLGAKFLFIYLPFVVLRFELRASCLLGRSHTPALGAKFD
jgi:hypothetical protein